MNYLAQHPATAKRIAHKLATRFVGDNPPAALVHSLAAIYRHHKTDIRPVLRALFSSKAFHHAEHVKYRTPFEDLVATLRSLRYQPDAVGTEGIRDLQWIAGSLGQPPLGWHAPNGYPRRRPGVGRDVVTTLARWNYHLSLAAHWWPDKLRAPETRKLLPKHPPATYGGLDALSHALYVPRLTHDQRAAVTRFVDHAPRDRLHARDEALGWRLPYLAALVLDSPKHAKR